MPSSYRKDTPTIATFKKLTKRAYCPKLSGGYNRVSRGARRTLKLCASAVPPPSIAIFLAKLPSEILLFPKKPLATPPSGGCAAISCVILEARSRVKKNESSRRVRVEQALKKHALCAQGRTRFRTRTTCLGLPLVR